MPALAPFSNAFAGTRRGRTLSPTTSNISTGRVKPGPRGKYCSSKGVPLPRQVENSGRNRCLR